MINVTEMLRKEGRLSSFEKIKSHLGPHLYHAENMKDFLDEVSMMERPRNTYWTQTGYEMHCVGITIYNVGLTRLYHPDDTKDSKPTHFLVHDEGGETKMNWEEGRFIFPPRNTFNDVHDEEGLTEDDWVFNVLFMHLVNEGLSYICEVQKNKTRRKPTSEESIDKARDFLPDLRPSFV